MFLADLLVVFAFGRTRVPSVVGLLVSGVLVGPHGLSLVADEESVKLLAEIGVIVPARGPPTDWGELVQAHDDREAVQGRIDELPVIDIHSL